jgi:hypothetical protein
MNLLESGQGAPEPYAQTSGVIGKSCVWFFCIPRGAGSAQHLVAKFDESERAATEWKAIEQLRRLNVPLHAILPLQMNQERHGVVIYQNTMSLTPSGNIVHLKELLHRQLSTNSANCLRALDGAFAALQLFYGAEPGAARMATEAGNVLRWGDLFPAITQQGEKIKEEATRIFIGMNVRSVRFDFDKLSTCNGRKKTGGLMNPLYDLERRLQETTGRVMFSRIHGDLNLTNILTGLDGRHAPDGIFIIDLANSRSEAPTAIDLARLESEFWHEGFSELNETGAAKESDILRTMVVVRDWLDRRTTQLPVKLSSLAKNAARWVLEIRREAIRFLKGQQNNYCLEDYMRALYFSHVRALGFKSVWASPAKFKSAFVGASLALEYISDLEAGKIEPPDVSTYAFSVPESHQLSKSSGDKPTTQYRMCNTPACPEPFVGRKNETGTIKNLLGIYGGKRQGVIAIHGQIGVGKSTFLAHLAWIQEIKTSFPDGVFWGALGKNANASEILRLWCQNFHIDAAGLLPDGMIAQLGAHLVDMHALLLIDDVWDARDLAPFLHFRHANVSMIVSSRFPGVASSIVPQNAIAYLPVFTKKDSLDLLSYWAPSVASEYKSDCECLVDELGNLPLAIQVAAKLLSNRIKLGLGDLTFFLNELRKGTEVLRDKPPASMVPFIKEANDNITVAELFRRSIEALPTKQARQCFFCLGVMAPKPATFDLTLIRSVCDFLDDPIPALKELVDFGLLEPLNNMRFQMHAMLVSYANSRLMEVEDLESIY